MTSDTSDLQRAEEQAQYAPNGGCDPRVLDELRCEAKGIEAQAAYNAKTKDELDQARTKYDGARAAYSQARSAAAHAVHDLEKQIGSVIEQLKCLVNDDHQTWLLGRAFHRVEERLEQCGHYSGCYFEDDCDFGEEVLECPPDDIAAAIADIERRVSAAKNAFADLIAEPTNLPTRVTDLRKEVDDIVKKMAEDPRTVDFKQLYAAALVAQWHGLTIWHGFEHANAYVDCLCKTLSCQFQGHTAISKLTRRQAVHACHDEASKARCDHLRTQTADEVMAEYIRLAHRHPESEAEGNGPGADDRTDDASRGRQAEEEREADRARNRDPDRARYGYVDRP